MKVIKKKNSEFYLNQHRKGLSVWGDSDLFFVSLAYFQKFFMLFQPFFNEIKNSK